MSDLSPIEWTDATWNPVRGCSRVSDGCVNCYAEKIAARFSGPGQAYEGLVHSTGAWNGRIRLIPEKLGEPLRWREPRLVFVDSMSDLFHENVPFEYIDRVFTVMACTTRHTYQILTKRPQRMLEYFQRLRDVDWFPEQILNAEWPGEWRPMTARRGGYDNCGPLWPLENVWLGVSVENQETADERIPLLLEVPAAVRFLSCEPLLGAIGFPLPCLNSTFWRRLHWIIVGGESGRGARSCSVDQVRDIIDQATAASCPVFVKQLGARPYEFRPAEGRPPGVEHALANLGAEHPQRRWFRDWTLVHDGPRSGWYRYARLKDSKGGDPNEWPEELKIRQWPQSRAVMERGSR